MVDLCWKNGVEKKNVISLKSITKPFNVLVVLSSGIVNTYNFLATVLLFYMFVIEIV